jgi:hypothetical protein
MKRAMWPIPRPKGNNQSSAQLAVRLFAIFKPELNDIIAPLCRNRNAGSAKAKKMLNRQPRNHEEAILAAAESLFRLTDKNNNSN